MKRFPKKRKDDPSLFKLFFSRALIAFLFFMIGALSVLFFHPTLRDIESKRLECMRNYHGTKNDCTYRIEMKPLEEIPITLYQ